ncbi:hypothetical protein [uncultured Aquimarina sp.]|uniref:hypothetical protein n=1 Tax=uncultured Aquimarina sp. TaxID=575652 RepID=UPI002630684B|nr:hypothetical protein [uncultured Aquimarina sp.]
MTTYKSHYECFNYRKTFKRSLLSDINGGQSKDENQNATYLYSIPKEMKTGSKKKPKYDARNAQIYWNERVIQIDEKIEKVKMLTLYNKL